MTIVLPSILICAGLGALRARSLKGSGKDMLHWAGVGALIGLVLGFLILIFVLRGV